MKIQRRSTILGIFYAAVLVATPLCVRAEDIAPAPPNALSSPVIITEIQTGVTGSADDEFIELYNASDDEVDIAGWELRFIKTLPENAQPPFETMPLATIASPAGGPVILLPGEHYVLKMQNTSPDIPANQTYPYANRLTNTTRLLALFAPDYTTCRLEVADAVAWVEPESLIVGEGTPLPRSGVSVDRWMGRYVDEAGNYIDTDNNRHDFAIQSPSGTPPFASSASPGAIDPENIIPAATDGDDAEGASAAASLASIPITAGSCGQASNTDDVPPEQPGEIVPPPAIIEETPETGGVGAEPPKPVIPAGNVGLKPPVLSELLPNPASPQTDKNDEFIELYNPNDAHFDLSGYILEVGLTTKRRYTIPAGTMLPPKAFLAFFSAETKLALSNSGSQVALLDPLGRVLVISEPYGAAKDGQAWVFANGIWQWTTKPTPNALNVVSAPAVKSKSTAKKSSSVSTASATKSGTGSQSGDVRSMEDIEEATVVAASSTPLHPGALALIAVSAVLYGAYEYRRDVANRIHQFRANRAARRALRQSAQGR